jgi:hypothetical protein
VRERGLSQRAGYVFPLAYPRPSLSFCPPRSFSMYTLLRKRVIGRTLLEHQVTIVIVINSALL